MQQQIGGFVPGIVGTVAKKQLGLVKPADGKAHQVAQGGKFALGLFKHEESGYVMKKLIRRRFCRIVETQGEFLERGAVTVGFGKVERDFRDLFLFVRGTGDL